MILSGKGGIILTMNNNLYNLHRLVISVSGKGILTSSFNKGNGSDIYQLSFFVCVVGVIKI